MFFFKDCPWALFLKPTMKLCTCTTQSYPPYAQKPLPLNQSRSLPPVVANEAIQRTARPGLHRPSVLLCIPEWSPDKDSSGEMAYRMYAEGFCKILTSELRGQWSLPTKPAGKVETPSVSNGKHLETDSLSASPEDHPQALFLIAPLRCCFCTNSLKPDHVVITNSLCFMIATVHGKRRKAFQFISWSQYNPGTNRW